MVEESMSSRSAYGKSAARKGVAAAVLNIGSALAGLLQLALLDFAISR